VSSATSARVSKKPTTVSYPAVLDPTPGFLLEMVLDFLVESAGEGCQAGSFQSWQGYDLMLLEVVTTTIAGVGMASPIYIPMSSEWVPPEDDVVTNHTLYSLNAGNEQVHPSHELGQDDPIDIISIGVDSMELPSCDGPGESLRPAYGEELEETRHAMEDKDEASQLFI
jgi:hypothetical protein